MKLPRAVGLSFTLAMGCSGTTVTSVYVNPVSSNAGASSIGGNTSSGGTMTAIGGSVVTGTSSGGQQSSLGGAGSAGMAATATTATTGGTGTGGASQEGQSVSLVNCGLLLHMDEVAWTGTPNEVRDSSGAANHGTSVSGATTTNSPAKFGRAGTFNRSGYVSVPDSATLHGGGAFTISSWIYPTGLDGAASPGIVSKRKAYGVGTEFSVFVWSSNNVYVDVDGENDRFSSNAALANNAWYHVAVVFDGSKPAGQRTSLYINGQLDSVRAESSSIVTVSDAPVLIGDLPSGGDLFAGSIDEVVFWQRALSASEVQALYLSNSPL